MTKSIHFADTVRVLHVSRLHCTAYGNPMSLYLFQRVNTPEQAQSLDTFEAKNESNSYALCNLRPGDTVKLKYRRRGKSWDFVAVDYVPSSDSRFPTAYDELKTK